MSLLILVVDDEPDVELLFRQQFRRELRRGAFVMEFAQSANDALRMLSTADALTLLLILSDVNMPEMSGIELLPKIKAIRPHVPVIMITAYGDAATKEKALANGAEPSHEALGFLRPQEGNRTEIGDGGVTAHILVVDDEADLEALILQKFRREIRSGDIEFHFARDGIEALAVIDRNSHIEMVVSDINMPRMDGLTLLDKLQQSKEQLSTVIVSAYGDMANIERP